jgi:CO/xanthine dehydrogenase Mo-binding subunit
VSRARGADASESILGTRVLRTEDPRFPTTGRGYTEDVLAVFTGPDLAALPPQEDTGMLNQEIRQQPLATDIVRFVGKAVAAVATQEPTRATTPSSWSASTTPVRAENLVHVMRPGDIR